MKTKNRFLTITFCLFGCFLTTTAMSQSVTNSSFSYQGELTDNGSPANDDYDMIVSMLDGNSTVVGTPSTHLNVVVENGLFNLDVFFSFAAFDGFENYFFEVSVRKSSVGGAYTVLSPLQTMQAVPLATNLTNGSATTGQVLTFNGFQWAPSAAEPSPWTVNGSVLEYNNDVAVGTTTSSHRLTIKADTDNKALRLIGDSGSFGHGARLNFGDAERAYIDEDVDDHLTIHAFTGVSVTVSNTGNANLLAYIYGFSNSDGTIITGKSSTGFSVTQEATGRYRINISDTTINNNYIAIASLNSSSPKFTTVVVANDLFRIYVWDSNGNPSNHAFQFVVYRK